MYRAHIMMAALALSASIATAQSSKNLDFGAGGNTVGGPGARTLDAGALETIFTQSDETPLDLCATVVNVGKSGTFAGVGVVDPGGVSNANNAGAGEAATVCRKDASAVRITCVGSDSCQVLWRVDQSR